MKRPSRRLSLVLAASFFGLLSLVVFASRSNTEGQSGAQPAPSETVVVPPRSPSPRSVYPYGRVVVISIGVNEYPNLSPAADLKRAEADADAIGDLFQKQFGYEVVSLRGPGASKRNIEEALEKYGTELGDQDALIVYFAGHGQVVELPSRDRAGFLVPSDARLDLESNTDPGRWKEQAIDMDGLVERVNRMRACHVLVIADACCSGFLASRGALAQWDLKNLLFKKSRAVLCSTDPIQKAKDGRFTPALIEEMRQLDRPGQAPKAGTVYTFFNALHTKVGQESQGRMTPQFMHVGGDNGMFVFIPAAIDRDELKKDLRDLESPAPAWDGTALAPAVKQWRLRLQQVTTYEQFVAALEVPDIAHTADAERRRIDWEERFERFLRNARLGDLWAKAALSVCYERGLGTEKNPERAYYWARQADRVRSDPGVGRYLLGRCYQQGLGINASGKLAEEQSKKLYLESAENGFGPGCWAVAVGLLADNPTPDQVRQAGRLLEQAVAAGVSPAEVDLAVELFRERPGFEADIKRAVGLHEQAASRDNPLAHHKLYLTYSAGLSGYPARDLVKAERHLRRAVELGLADAQLALAYEYYGGSGSGLGLPKDPKKAFSLFDRAALQQHPQALCESAVALAAGDGTAVNYDLARERLEAAVRAGNAQAECLQGQWYLDGNVYEKSDAKALSCFRRAADRGHRRAGFEAGLLYLSGRGFAVMNAHSDGSFHDEWHTGLHYFLLAHRSGRLDKESKKVVEDALGGFADFLEGGAFSRDLDKQLRDNERGPTDGVYEEKYGGSGGPGQRRPVELRSGDVATVIRGELITRATRIAKEWKESHPTTFAHFCETWRVNPVTFAVIPARAKKGGK